MPNKESRRPSQRQLQLPHFLASPIHPREVSKSTDSCRAAVCINGTTGGFCQNLRNSHLVTVQSRSRGGLTLPMTPQGPTRVHFTSLRRKDSDCPGMRVRALPVEDVRLDGITQCNQDFTFAGVGDAVPCLAPQRTSPCASTLAHDHPTTISTMIPIAPRAAITAPTNRSSPGVALPTNPKVTDDVKS